VPGSVPLVKNDDSAAVVWRAVTATVELIDNGEASNPSRRNQKLVVSHQSLRS